MKKVLLVIAVIAVGLLVLGLSQAISSAGQTTTIAPEVVPKVLNFVGSGLKTLSPARYPIFSEAKGDSATCVHKLHNVLSGKHKPNMQNVYEVAMETGAIQIDEKYRSGGKIIVTWNLRILGEAPSPLAVWPSLCSPWHGTVKQKFTGGNAYSKVVVVAGNVVKEVPNSTIKMTIPDPGVVLTATTISDPTHTGSIVITPADFAENKLPAEIKLKMYWSNDTSLNLRSEDKMRSIVVTLTRN